MEQAAGMHGLFGEEGRHSAELTGLPVDVERHGLVDQGVV